MRKRYKYFEISIKRKLSFSIKINIYIILSYDINNYRVININNNNFNRNLNKITNPLIYLYYINYFEFDKLISSLYYRNLFIKKEN